MSVRLQMNSWQLVLLTFSLHAATDTKRLSEKARQMFYHGFKNHMRHAHPFDELAPLSCTRIGRDHQAAIRSRLHQELASNNQDHPIRAGLCLTLVDAADTLAIMGDTIAFHKAVDDIVECIPAVNVDVDVSVFEINIRVIGGLLSAHQFCSGYFGEAFTKKGYNNQLLKIAYDLAERLLPAFKTSTGIPRARVNLQIGSLCDAKSNCPAAGATFILEFGMLSVLTGDMRFYRAAERALFAVWEHRSDMDLIGYEIDVEEVVWVDPASTIGAGADSFYEYLLKGYLLFGDPALLQVYQESRLAIRKNMLDRFGQYVTVDYARGGLRSGRLDALGAFYPGLLVLGGEVEAGREAFDVYYLAAQSYGAGLLPEAIDIENRRTISLEFNLRPELAESAYYLYQATRDPFYLRAGEQILNLIEERCKTEFGYAAIADSSTGNQKIDRTESFLLSETLKYLYLLFETDHWTHKHTSPTVFTTEAHLFTFPKHMKPLFSCDLFYKCSKTLHQGRDIRMLQTWNSKLSLDSIDHYQKLWGRLSLDNLNTKSSASLMTTFETVLLLKDAIVYTERYGIIKAENMTFSIWPSLKRPSLVVSAVSSGHPITWRDNVRIIGKKDARAPSFVKYYDNKWKRMNRDMDGQCTRISCKCPISLELRHPSLLELLKAGVTEPYSLIGFKRYQKNLDNAAFLREFEEDKRTVSWAGFQVVNSQMSVLPKFAFKAFSKRRHT